MSRQYNVKDTTLTGIDTAPMGNQDGAEAIVNLRYDWLLKCWSNDRTFVPLLDPDTATYTPAEDVYSIYSWVIRGTEHVLFEKANGTTLDLCVLIGQTIHTLATGRNIPAGNVAGTQYISNGQVLIIMNGVDDTLIYYGDKYIRPVVSTRPSSISISTASVAYSEPGFETIGTFKRYASRTSGGIIYQFSPECGYGAGLGATSIDYFDGVDPTFYAEQQVNSYEYAISFITDTGSETAISGRSARISFLGGGSNQTDGDGNNRVTTARYGFELNNIPLGPPGTIKRRVYRTKNIGGQLSTGATTGGAGETLYFAFDIQDNTSKRTIDALPDTQLGSEAPLSFERQVFPRTSLGTSYRGRFVTAGDKNNPLMVYISDAGTPEQFSARNAYNVPSKTGGLITGLTTYNNLCLVFRETAIHAITITSNGFDIVPIVENIGCESPNTIQVVQGVGCVFLGNDGNFYSLQGNYSGGSQIQIKNISGNLGNLLQKINTGSLARAWSCYNPSEKELWCHVPSRGRDIPTLGFVFHTSTGGWSMRPNWPLNCCTVLTEKVFCVGTMYEAFNSATPQGIMVWSGLGTASTYPESYYETAWLSMGLPNTIKTVTDIVLYFYKNEYNADSIREPNVTVYGSVDYKPYARVIGTASAASTEASSPGIFGVLEIDGTDNPDYYNWDANRTSAREVITVRLGSNLTPDIGYIENVVPVSGMYANSSQSGGCRWIKLRIMDLDKEFRFLGWSINYTYNGSTGQLNSYETSSPPTV